MIEIKNMDKDKINIKITFNNISKEVTLIIKNNICFVNVDNNIFDDNIGKKLYFSIKNYAFFHNFEKFYINNEKINIEKKYKTLMFDLDETIFDFKLSEKKAIIKTMLYFNVDISEKDTCYFSKINDELFNLFSKGIIKERIVFQEKRIKDFADYLGVSIDASLGNKLYIKYLEESSDIFKESVRVLQTLSKKYRIIAVTNGMYNVQVQRLKNAGLFNFFKAIYVSSEIGAHKPDVFFFNEVLKRENNYNLKDYLIIGDSENSDMQGGINIGIDTCFLNRKNIDSSMIYTYEIKNLDELLKNL